MTFIHDGKIQSPIEAVLLDWDNTLARASDNYTLEYFRRTFEKMKALGYPIPENFTLADKEVYVNYGQFYEHLWGKEGAAIALAMLHETFDSISYDAVLLEGAYETLTYLRDHHIPTAIVTSLPQWKIGRAVRRILGDDFPDLVVVGEGNGIPRKPDRGSFYHALEQLHVAPSRKVFHVGDHSQFDVVGAVEAGLTGILFNQTQLSIAKFLPQMTPEHRGIVQTAPAARSHAQLQYLFDEVRAGKNITGRQLE